MKSKILQIAILLNLIVMLTGCIAATEPPRGVVTDIATAVTPEAHVAEVSATIIEPSETPVVATSSVPDLTANCPAAASGSQLYVDEENGFCLLYPDDFIPGAYRDFSYDRVQFTQLLAASPAQESVGISMVIESNGMARGQNSTQYAEKWIINFGGADKSNIEDLLINGLEAASLGIETEFGPMMQSVFITANDYKYRINLTPMMGTAPVLEPGLQTLYDTITGSIVFFAPQSERQYVAPEDVCPQETGGYKQYIHLTEGYCLLYPADFELAEDFAGDFNGGPILEEDTDWGDVRASLTVGTAGYFSGQTVMDVLQTRMEFIDKDSIEEMTIAGYPAVIFRDPRGPWASRQAMIMMNGFVYTLVNQPWEPERYPEGMVYLDSIWNSVIGSLAFFDPWR